MKKMSVGAALLAAVLAIGSPANASLTSFLSITGKSSGQVKGSVTQKGREGKIAIIAADHRVGGAPTGRKQHGLFVVTKELDKSTPILYKMLVSNEVISDFELQYFEPNVKGAVAGAAEVQHYKVKLTNARIASIKFVMQTTQSTESLKTEVEEVSFSYESITWSYDSASTTDSAAAIAK